MRATALRDDLGMHNHEITTSPDSAWIYFNQGLRLTYEFSHPIAIGSYEQVARFDPEGGAAARAVIPRALELPDRDHLTGSERAYVEVMALRSKEDPRAAAYPEIDRSRPTSRAGALWVRCPTEI